MIKGDVIIENVPQVSAVIDRVEGVKQVLANYRESVGQYKGWNAAD
jgi:ABC-type sugar transport system substrate-binding protein